jgi:DnaJ like chaperone protein
MAITGKLIGALIGSIAGPFGTLFGGLIGHFFDRASDDRRFLEGSAGWRGTAEGSPWGERVDPVSQAQLNFLTCLVGLSVCVASADGRMKASHLEAMRGFFRGNFSFPVADQDLIQRLVEEMHRNRERIDVQGLCAYYAAVSTPEGRVLLLRLLFQIARSDSGGITRVEEELIRRIAFLLGLGEQVYRQVRAEFRNESGRAYQILGIAPNAEVEEIKSAYRQLTMANHPDKVANLGPEFVKVAEEKFKAIQAAYEEIRHEKGF